MRFAWKDCYINKLKESDEQYYKQWLVMNSISSLNNSRPAITRKVENLL